ncbi:MAG: ATP-binding protein [Eubacterium sp.]|nr:ATP-binding protein [Eubacterium sp.]
MLIGKKISDLSEFEELGGEAQRSVERAIAKNIAVGVLVGYYDEKLTIYYASTNLLHNLGYNEEQFRDLTKGSLRNLFYGENTSFLEQDRFPSILGRGEGEMLTQDGTPVTVRIYKEDAEDMKGTPLWVMSVRVDWEHENVTLINGAMKSGLWYFDCNKQGEIKEVHWSHAFRRILGYHDILDFPNELSSWSDLLHPMDRERTLKLLTDAIADTTGKIKYDIDYRLKMQDGTYQWFHANAGVVRRMDGTARRITGLFVNIDEEKKTLMGKKKAEAFHDAFTKTNLCEYYVDLLENSFESMKEDAPLLSGVTPGMSWDDLIHMYADTYVCEEYKQKVEKFYSRSRVADRLKQTEGELNLECCITLEGEKRWVQNVILPGEKEQSRYAIVFLRDITKEREQEILSRRVLEEAYDEAEKANRAKTKFLTNMSHDIRTPMNAIVGLTAIAGANLSKPEKVEECLNKITVSSRHLLGLINDVLDMSRIENGEMSLAEEEFSLSELVDNLVTMTKPDLEAHRHTFHGDRKTITHDTVWGDPMRLQQIFTNLMSNAIKYTPDGGTIKCSIEEKESGQPGIGCYQFLIQDNGIGMEKEFQKIMFQPFVRADDKRITKAQGTGLGMTITKSILNKMNGDIQVESTPGEGTRITVTFFLKIQEQSKALRPEKNDLKELEKKDYSHARILLVEDNELNQEIAAEIIGMTNAAIDIAEDGKKAVEMIESKPEDWYDLIFMDIQMPVMNGYETTAVIRAMAGRRGRTPIVAMTANAFAEDVQMAKNTGMNEHIAKPLDLGKLKEIMKKYISAV